MHGLSILQMFDDDHQVVTVAQIARQIGVHRSNASRLAATLHALGFLTRADEAGQYRLGPQLIRLGRLAGAGNDLSRQAAGPLRALVRLTGETGHIGILDGTDAVTSVVVDGWHTVRMHSRPNKRSPAHNSSIGKALLAGLDDTEIRRRYRGRRLSAKTPNSITSLAGLLREVELIRARGYAVDDEELETGLRCLAAPITDAAGTVVASLGLSGPALRMTEAAVADLAPHVCAAAAEATRAIGGRAEAMPPAAAPDASAPSRHGTTPAPDGGHRFPAASR
ncbi:IclR family transcriptional regulator [Mangrovihabitans endophyticus]|uniref:IclR family transcriptional regulator n=1 Tax=Mangrovihabitans endophyticus TaxID=1751298 RepID=A0A8J3FQG9_9ACTN|nr:IclR family transcriptional regulator [Mangrovihabitans endophyticus]